MVDLAHQLRLKSFFGSKDSVGQIKRVRKCRSDSLDQSLRELGDRAYSCIRRAALSIPTLKNMQEIIPRFVVGTTRHFDAIDGTSRQVAMLKGGARVR